METNINPSTMSTVLILMASASLFTMLSLTQINRMVHSDLYDYGLQFSYRWAMPYWVSSGIVFGLSWANIAIALIVTVYIFRKRRKQALDSENIPRADGAEEAAQLNEENEQRKLSEYVESQKEELTAPKEESVETSHEQLIEEEIKEPKETVETIDAQETQPNQQTTEEGNEPKKETDEVPIPPEDVEKRQSIL